MEEKIKELEYENSHLQKELREQYRLLKIALKRQRWYNFKKFIFTKSLDDEYQALTDKISNKIKVLEESIETNFISINNIASEREYIVEKLEKQKTYNSKYWEKVRSKKLYEKEYQRHKNNKLFNYDHKNEIIKDILHNKFDGIVLNDYSLKTCVIDRNNKYIVEL